MEYKKNDIVPNDDRATQVAEGIDVQAMQPDGPWSFSFDVNMNAYVDERPVHSRASVRCQKNAEGKMSAEFYGHKTIHTSNEDLRRVSQDTLEVARAVSEMLSARGYSYGWAVLHLTPSTKQPHERRKESEH